jgi:hypothetical protein
MHIHTLWTLKLFLSLAPPPGLHTPSLSITHTHTLLLFHKHNTHSNTQFPFYTHTHTHTQTFNFHSTHTHTTSLFLCSLFLFSLIFTHFFAPNFTSVLPSFIQVFSFSVSSILSLNLTLFRLYTVSFLPNIFLNIRIRTSLQNKTNKKVEPHRSLLGSISPTFYVQLLRT